MLRWILTGIVLLCCGWATLAQADADPTAAPVQVEQLTRLLYARADQTLAEEAARNLQRNLQRNGSASRPITAVEQLDDAGAILLGPTLALAAKLTTPAEVAALAPEGFIVRGHGRQVALIANSPSGLAFASYAFLRELGMHWHPWRDGNALNAVLQMPAAWPGTIPALELRDEPWFRFRDVLNQLDLGKYGGTIRSHLLADPRDGENPELFGRSRKDYSPFTFTGSDYVDWFHTAGYLIPRDLYLAQHPEYFAMHDGQRDGPQRYVRTAICMSNPQVRAISAQRAGRWMDLRPQQRFFSVVQSDAPLCECPQCLARDPLPDSSTDRVLEWVNHVAGKVGPTHPDKLILASAYLQTVKPPRRVMPAPNVCVLYSPWFWNSRASSATTLASPLNVTAMRELMGWLTCAPQQVGIYDYPGSYAWGTAERIKQYARLGIRDVYFNGLSGDLTLWLGGRLTWDPLLDTTPLVREFCTASYGPAADAMFNLQALRHDAQQVFGRHSRAVWRQIQQTGPAASRTAFDQARQFAMQALSKIADAEPAVQLRTGSDCLDVLHDWLLACSPTASRAELRCSAAEHDAVLNAARELGTRLFALSEQVQAPRLSSGFKRQIERFEQQISSAAPAPAALDAEAGALHHRTAANDDTLGSAARIGSHTTALATASAVQVTWTTPAAAAMWRMQASVPALAAAPVLGQVELAGQTFTGVKLHAPLTQLPTAPAASLQLHAGRFLAHTTLPTPLPRAGHSFIEWHLHADAPATVTLYADQVRTDVALHGGWQLVRLDLRVLDEAKTGSAAWPSINTLAVEIWPQDGEYPHPAAQDVNLTVLSVALRGAEPELPTPFPAALWLSHYHANVPHQLPALRLHPDLCNVTTEPTDPAQERRQRAVAEPYRSFTEHRSLSPLLSISTAGNAQLAAVAQQLQTRLMKGWGVSLPIDSTPAAPAGNQLVLLTFDQLPLADQPLVQWAGVGGFIIDAAGGRVLLAGADSAQVAQAARLYLDDHRPEPRLGHTLERDPWLHELFTVDRPWFASMPQVQNPQPLAVTTTPALTAVDWQAAHQLAQDIKRLARQSRTAWPADFQQQALRLATDNPLARLVLDQMQRDPFVDSDVLIRQGMRSDDAP